MIGTTLVGIREHIEALADPDGSYYVVCGRTGERPVPAAELRFESRERAREAARATKQYRSALRQYDPRTPRYDLIVVEASQSGRDIATEAPCDEMDEQDRTVWALDSGASLDRHRIEFCHRVSAAIFESLSDGDYDDVERAVMDEYVELAESIEDPDNLCLCLLGTLAAALDDRLTPDEQAALLATAAEHLPPATRSKRPVTAALTVLEQRGLVGEFECSLAAMDRDGQSRSVVATLGDYALSPQNGRLPVLPVVVELYRQRIAWSPPALRVSEATDGWQVTVEFGSAAEPGSLSTAPIRY